MFSTGTSLQPTDWKADKDGVEAVVVVVLAIVRQQSEFLTQQKTQPKREAV